MQNFKRKRVSSTVIPKPAKMVPAASPKLFDNLKASDQLLTTVELAAVLKMSPHTIRKWRHREQIPYIKVGLRSIRFHLATIQSWLQTRGGQPSGDN